MLNKKNCLNISNWSFQLFGKLLKGLSFKCSISGVKSGKGASGTITLTGDSNDNKVEMYDHSHIFRNLPLTLTDTNEEVREIAESNNETEINAATEVYNRRKTYDKNNPRS